MSQTHAYDRLISSDYSFLTDAQISQLISLENISSCVVNHKLRSELLDIFLYILNFFLILFVSCFICNSDILADGSFCLHILRVDSVIVGINNVAISIRNMVSLVSVSLMCI